MKWYDIRDAQGRLLCEVEAPNKTEARREAQRRLNHAASVWQDSNFNNRCASMQIVEIK